VDQDGKIWEEVAGEEGTQGARSEAKELERMTTEEEEKDE
jgi:hypothetical protein